MNFNYFRNNFHPFNVLNKSIWDLPSPSSISYFWNFGSVLGLCLILQILSGLFLSFHYVSFSEESFHSISYIMREIWFGWFFRYIHMNGASLFFFFIYMHIFRGIYFFSFSNSLLWFSGMILFFLLMAISFLGYVLPWGQMSYWGVAVITNLFTVIPLIGEDLVKIIWGGFSVSSVTLVRFYSFHFFFPFILSFFALFHLIFLHKKGSSNPLNISSSMDKILFHPFFSIKDVFFFVIVVILFMTFCFYYPLILGDSINNVPSDPMSTPTHIQPEWYFLPFYAVLRSVSSKSLGVFLMISTILVIVTLIFFNYSFSSNFNLSRDFFFFLFIFNFLYLIFLGSTPAEDPYVSFCKPFSFLYFLFIFLCSI